MVIDDFVFSAKPSSQVSSITSTITFKKLYHPGNYGTARCVKKVIAFTVLQSL